MTVFYIGNNKITLIDLASSKDNSNMEVSAKLAIEVKKNWSIKVFSWNSVCSVKGTNL